jgi:hypothetical protein
VLDARNHQGKFAEDYVRALASAAGLLIYQDDLDYDGIDLGFRFPGKVGRVSSPAIEVQVKSISTSRYVNGALNFSGLNEVQFNRLAGPGFFVPRYLFLVVVPSDPDSYVRMETDGMLLRQLGFFCSLRREPPVVAPEQKRRRAVRVPLGNVLTVRSLLELVRGTPTELRADHELSS